MEKAIIRLEDEPYKIIKWFTHNFNKEVGAFGVGKLTGGELVVSKLVFPTQTVNGGHVHIKPENWACIAQELSDEEMQNICFYWHKHPDNFASASSGDEEETFAVIMDPIAKRKFFGFAQTSMVDGRMKYDARIEINKPVKAAIPAELTTYEDLDTETLCDKIIKDKIKVGNLGGSDQPGFLDDRSVTILANKTGNNLTTQEGYYHYNKEATERTDRVIIGVKISSGHVELDYSSHFEDLMDDILTTKTIKELISSTTFRFDKKSIHKDLWPNKKCLQPLYKVLKEIELVVAGDNDPLPGITGAEEDNEGTIRDGLTQKLIDESVEEEAEKAMSEKGTTLNVGLM